MVVATDSLVSTVLHRLLWLLSRLKGFLWFGFGCDVSVNVLCWLLVWFYVCLGEVLLVT